ncbi:MAG: hypothetical protein Q9M29_08360, partial [Mariprofundaceae bacterium]|nr:hypothetical protein [Mariprofundaceae bacterium]
PLAWSYPRLALAVCVFDFTVLTILAFSLQTPIPHAMALACLIAGWLVGAGQLVPETASVKVMQQEILGPMEFALLPLVVLLGLVSEFLCRFRLREHAVYYGLGCAAAITIGLGYSIPAADMAAPLAALKPMLVFGIFGIGGLVFNARWRRPIVTSLSLALLVAATLWCMRAVVPDKIATWTAVLAIEGLLMSLAAVCLRRHTLFFYREPLARSAEAIVPLAVVSALWSGWPNLAWGRPHLIAGFAVSGLFVLTAAIARSRSRLRWANAFLFATACRGATTYLAGTDWFAQHAGGLIGRFLDPRSLYTYGMALAIYGFICSLGRVGLQRWRVQPIWLETHWPAWDRTILRALAFVLAGFAVIGIAPISASEWLPTRNHAA